MKKTEKNQQTVTRGGLLSALVGTVLCILLALTALTSCTAEREQRDFAAKLEAGKTLKIGVIQFMRHPSLDNCYRGIEEGLRALDALEVKYEIDLQVGSDASAVSDVAAYARSMVARDYDMIIAIATPAAQAAYTAALDTDIPVLFCAVSDPVSAKLADSMERVGDLCVGTADVLDLSAQLDMIEGLQSDVKKIGVIYTSSEANSVSNLKRFRALCADRGIEVVARAIQNANEISTVARALAREVDCINNFTDNNLVNNLSIVLEAAAAEGIPVYGSEEEQVRLGCVGSMSIDYVTVGRETASLAIRAIRGEKIKDMAVTVCDEAYPVYNDGALGELGLVKPED